MTTRTELALAPSSLAIFPDYVAQQQETLVIKGRQFGATFDVKTIDGRALATVEPGTASLSRRKRVLDTKGKLLFNVRRESWHFGGSRYFIDSPSRSDNPRLLTVEFKMFATGTHFTASFVDTTSLQQEQLLFDRGYFSTNGKITKGADGPVVADTELFISMLKKEYQVVVAQGVDMALIAAMLICLDDKEKSHGNAPGLGGGRI